MNTVALGENFEDEHACIRSSAIRPNGRHLIAQRTLAVEVVSG
jgi:hypothetical protein